MPMTLGYWDIRGVSDHLMSGKDLRAEMRGAVRGRDPFACLAQGLAHVLAGVYACVNSLGGGAVT